MKPKILRQCLQTAIDNNTPDLPEWECYHHFSFLVQNNKIVGFGKNRRGSPFTILGYDKHTKIHSEVDAIYKLKGLLEKGERFEVVNIRLTKTNVIRASDPCKCCFAFMKHYGCYRVWFTTNLGNFACMII